MNLSHRIALDLTVKQRRYCARAAGTARFVWNWALAEWDRKYREGGKPSGLGLKAAFNAVKYQAFPWMRDVHRDAHSQPFANLQKAFVAFFKGTAKRPTFKSKRRCRDSFYVANDKLRIDGKRVRLPVLGWVRMTEALRFTGKAMSATVSRTADRWFISFQVDVGDYRRERKGDGAVGVDLGLKHFATLSTGEQIDAPKPLKRFLRRLGLAQRSLSRRLPGSMNREKQRRKVAMIHARVAAIRNDFLHKLSTRLCENQAAIGVENLNVAGMMRNRRLSRAISDVGWGEFSRQLNYKGPIFGCQVTAADRWEPSSKRCHRCGTVKATLALSERTFYCESCGLVCDRDFNASMNLVPAACRESTPGDIASAMVEPETISCSLVGTK